jgi:tetratricopeptide (TPR) repeat protein
VLVTSRVALRVPGEHVVDIEPLPLRPAADLFVRRAQRADPSFVLDTTNEDDVGALCAALDGLPLAIELAAARVRALPPQLLVQRIDQRLRLLTGGTGRHQTLRAAVEWSVDLLDARTAQVFARLAVFRGGWTLHAAEVVAGLPPLEPVDVLSCLAELVDQHLVLPPSNGSRFAMLETIREYAELRLAAAADAASVRTAHRGWYLDLARAQAQRVRGPDQDVALALLDAEHANLVSALADACAVDDADVAYRLAAALGGYWDARSLLVEAITWLERVIAQPPPSARRRDAVVQWAGYFAFLLGDTSRARQLAQDSCAYARAEGLDGPLGYALLRLGQVEVEAGDLELGAQHLRESAAALERAGDRWGTARPINNLGEVLREQGHLDEAVLQHQAALAICRELGDDSSLPNVLSGLGQVLVRLGDLDGARDAGEEALQVACRLRNRIGEAYALEVLALAAVEQGTWTTAASALAQAAAIRDVLGAPVERRDREMLDAAAARVCAVVGGEAAVDGSLVDGSLADEDP